MKILRSPCFLICPVLLLLISGTIPARGQGNLMGVWSFDPARKQVYVDSVNRGRAGVPMSEIAAAMGLARIEDSLYELGSNRDGPFLSITNKTSRATESIRVAVERAASELILTAKEGGRRFRLKPIDPHHLDLVDDQNRVTIPLKRT